MCLHNQLKKNFFKIIIGTCIKEYKYLQRSTLWTSSKELPQTQMFKNKSLLQNLHKLLLRHSCFIVIIYIFRVWLQSLKKWTPNPLLVSYLVFYANLITRLMQAFIQKSMSFFLKLTFF